MSEKGKNDAFSWISLVISVIFIVKGIIKLSGNSPVYGMILLVLGIVGLCWKGYEMIRERA